jgi:hypothetical protein
MIDTRIPTAPDPPVPGSIAIVPPVHLCAVKVVVGGFSQQTLIRPAADHHTHETGLTVDGRVVRAVTMTAGGQDPGPHRAVATLPAEMISEAIEDVRLDGMHMIATDARPESGIGLRL